MHSMEKAIKGMCEMANKLKLRGSELYLPAEDVTPAAELVALLPVWLYKGWGTSPSLYI